MLLLIKLIELAILFFVIKVFFKMIFPGFNRDKSSNVKNTKEERFDCDGADVSDGEFKEIS